jgi:ribosome-associated protein
MQEETPSKTRRKQEMHALQALGAELVGLGASHLEAMGLPEALLRAVLDAQRIKSHEAKRRQMQYIGRLMRDVDAAPIREHLAALRGDSEQAAAQHRRLEALRARLLEDDEALTDFAAAHPGTDLQGLRSLLRSARKEQKEGKPPRAYRELFRFLKDAAASPPSQG